MFPSPHSSSSAVQNRPSSSDTRRPPPTTQHTSDPRPSITSTDTLTRHHHHHSNHDHPHTATEDDQPDEVVMTVALETRKSGRFRYINQYELQRSLGRGQHGEVSIAFDLKKQKSVAVKAVKRKNPKLDRMSQLRRRPLPQTPHTHLTDVLGSTEHKIRKEIAIMKKCRHPHVVRLLEVIDDRLSDKIYMVMEYLEGGEIKWRTPSGDPILRVDQTRRICRDVILGLEYLHNQGIIHRDIKPANLLWTADRRTVKIADFGVSHFSYAQRLSSPDSKSNKQPDDDYLDPILMDDSDLSKFAGTPMFLAPEIVADSSTEFSSMVSVNALLAPTTTTTAVATPLGSLPLSNPDIPYPSSLHPPQPSSSTSSTSPSPTSSPNPNSKSSTTTQLTVVKKKPPITKAIDIWAFGVTLYGLLFGTLPFRGDNEYQIYTVIRQEDWDVPETMGMDRIPVGGRYQVRDRRLRDREREGAGQGTMERETDGYLVVHLLEGLLHKDANKRLTLEGFKKHPWILRDMPDPHEWLRKTEVNKRSLPPPTEDETNSAISSVRFRWHSGLTRRFSKFIDNVRHQRSFRKGSADTPTASSSGTRAQVSNTRARTRRATRRREEEEGKDVGTRSAPHVSLTRHKSSAAVLVREKGKQAATTSAVSTNLTSRNTGSLRSMRKLQGVGVGGPTTGRNKSVGDVSLSTSSGMGAGQVHKHQHSSSSSSHHQQPPPPPQKPPFEPFSGWASAPGPSILGSSKKQRRGSVHSQVQLDSLQVPVASSAAAPNRSTDASTSIPIASSTRTSSPQPPPTPHSTSPPSGRTSQISSPTTTEAGSQSLVHITSPSTPNPEERTKSGNRISAWLRGWRGSKQHGTSGTGTATHSQASSLGGLSSPREVGSSSTLASISPPLVSTAAAATTGTVVAHPRLHVHTSGPPVASQIHFKDVGQGPWTSVPPASSTGGAPSVAATSASASTSVSPVAGPGQHAFSYAYSQTHPPHSSGGTSPTRLSMSSGGTTSPIGGFMRRSEDALHTANVHMQQMHAAAAANNHNSHNIIHNSNYPHSGDPHSIGNSNVFSGGNVGLNLASRQSSGGTSSDEPLAYPMRAASWGEMHDHAYGGYGAYGRRMRPSEDLERVSLSPSAYTTPSGYVSAGGGPSGSLSAGHGGQGLGGGGSGSGNGGGGGQGEEGDLDRDTWFLGAGGIAQSPVPSLPSVGGERGVLSTVSSTASLGPPVIPVGKAWLQRNSGEVGSSEGGTSAGGGGLASTSTSAGSMVAGRTAASATSPLAIRSSPSPSLSSSSSFVSTSSRSQIPSATPERTYRLDYDDDDQPNTSQMYRDEDAEEDDGSGEGSESDEEEVEVRPLEVRTRRPSATVGFEGGVKSGFMGASASTVRGASVGRSPSTSRTGGQGAGKGSSPPLGPSSPAHPPPPQRAHSQRSERTMICT